MKDVEAFSDWWEQNSDRLGGSTDIGFDELSQLGQRSVQMVNVKSGKELGVPMGETIRIRSKSSGAQRTLESEGAFLGGAMIQAAKLQNPITVDNQNNLLNRSIADPQHYYGYHWGARVPLTKLAEQKIQAMLSDVPDSVISFSSGLIEGLSKDDASKFTAALFKLCQQDAPQGMRQGMCKPFENWYETGNDPSLMDYYFEINQVDKYYNFGPSVESKGLARQMGMPINAGIG
ncbi:hypothetical protein C9I98_08145 [Photobacterium sanctipauli]|uniref:Uncharacterized protein n=1 Tax=Photobacterium sanctipauli TaxID=1342794 RepID=A0A2T3NX69_9GAMM|nr:hypothetical protein [Photobacterium sanctipauli]PSW20799.1 hypothetical protein C9I98_08145 [Photobacterium sanctipauli]